MKEVISKIFRISNFQLTDKSITFNIQNFPSNYLNKIEFKNTFTTDISKVESPSNELFFYYFPNKIDFDFVNDLLPPRTFFNYSDTPKYLLTQNSQKEIEEYCPYMGFVKNLKFFGTLKQKKDKTVYLEIENDFLINLVSSSLKNPQIEKFKDLIINVISTEEYEDKEVFKIDKCDLNQKYQFQIKGLYSINIQDEEYTDKIWFLEIESKELEEFRYKYHLFPKINGYNFSIVLGSKKYFKLRKSFPKMKINITFSAA